MEKIKTYKRRKTAIFRPLSEELPATEAEKESGDLSPVKIEAKRLQSMKLLGQGAFGKVYEIPSEQEALKVMKCQELEPEHWRELYTQTLLSQRIPGLTPARAVQWSQAQEQLSVRMPLASWTLWDHLQLMRGAPTLSLSEIHTVAQHILCALVGLHSVNVLHLDLKPQNILVFPDKTVRLSDFGLATSKYALQHRRGSELITANYRAPEVNCWSVEAEMSASADIFAFGVILAELLGTWLQDGKFTEPVFKAYWKDPLKYALHLVDTVGSWTRGFTFANFLWPESLPCLRWAGNMEALTLVRQIRTKIKQTPKMLPPQGNAEEDEQDLPFVSRKVMLWFEDLLGLDPASISNVERKAQESKLLVRLMWLTFWALQVEPLRRPSAWQALQFLGNPAETCPSTSRVNRNAIALLSPPDLVPSPAIGKTFRQFMNKNRVESSFTERILHAATKLLQDVLPNQSNPYSDLEWAAVLLLVSAFVMEDTLFSELSCALLATKKIGSQQKVQDKMLELLHKKLPTK